MKPPKHTFLVIPKPNRMPAKQLVWMLLRQNLTSLPQLPEELLALECSHNNLTSLPNLPDKLHTLYCCNNYLTSLPHLPSNLEFLDCSKNNLTHLPPLSKNLRLLICQENDLTTILPLPDALESLHCAGNPGLFSNDLTDWKKLDKLRKHLLLLKYFNRWRKESWKHKGWSRFANQRDDIVLHPLSHKVQKMFLKHVLPSK